jgi:acid phosphatase type 7
MQIQWLHQDTLQSAMYPPRVAYRELGSTQWHFAESIAESFPVVDELTYRQYGEHPVILRSSIVGLEPDSEYEFMVEPHDIRHKFRTVSDTLTAPVRFVVGGDVDISANAIETYEAVSATNPDFVVIGGDIAYENGTDTNRIIQWMQQWSEHMITPDGRIIPVLAAIGNHESTESWTDPALSWEEVRSRAPFFLTIFDCLYRHRSYATMDFGVYLSLFLLDTNHLSTIDGAQAGWLADAMADRHASGHLIPIYHVPAWPSVRNLDNEISAAVRAHWIPIFEANNVLIAFEHHDHAYKRTWPLLDDAVDPLGITYVGDGAWGRTTRTPKDPDEHYYLRVTEERHHAIVVDIHADGRIDVSAIASGGDVFDEFTIDHLP